MSGETPLELPERSVGVFQYTERGSQVPAMRAVWQIKQGSERRLLNLIVEGMLSDIGNVPTQAPAVIAAAIVEHLDQTAGDPVLHGPLDSGYPLHFYVRID
jgi:hypothetical protein